MKRHLMLTHDMNEQRAWAVTDISEYWLRVRRAVRIEEDETDQESNAVRHDNRRRASKG